MSYDGIFTHLMVEELNNTLVNGRLSKIHQPYENEIMLTIRNNQANYTLLLSAHPSYARVQLTKLAYKNPMSPPNFCMTLRKYLEGSILKDITQVSNDRIIVFSFENRNDLGDLEDIVLIVELMGRHSNIILLNKETNKILDTIKHVGFSQNSYRLLLPGSTYITPPSQDKINPWTMTSEELFNTLNTLEDTSPTVIQTTFEGFALDTATELSYRFNESPKELITTWQTFLEELSNNTNPTIGLSSGKTLFSPIAYHAYTSIEMQFATLSEMLDSFYSGKAEKDRVKQQAGELIKKVANDLSKLKKKQKKLERSLIDADNSDIYRIKGELLTTYLHMVPKGAKEVSLPNYYEEDKLLDIALDPALSVNKNAQKYFQRYQKLKKGVSIVKEQLEKTAYDILYLESVSSQLEIATPEDVEYIREELIAEKYIKIRQKDRKKQKQKLSKPLKFESSDGDIIFVGKNNLQNDQLTLKTAHKLDIWLHAKDIPGSHVIIKNNDPSEQTILEAALLAAYHSKYRLSSSVPVDYVAAKHVKKPNGSKPGYVIYENQKTIYVTPETDLVNNIKRIK